MSRIRNHFWVQALVLLLVLGLSVAIVRTTYFNGPDFLVYYQSAHYFLHGADVYSTQRDGIMVFKYPPWILTLFLPVAFFGKETALLLWGVIQVVALLAILKSLARAGVRLATLGFTLLAFYPIVLNHALLGQIALPILAMALPWSGESPGKKGTGFRFWAVSTGLSVKLLPLLLLISLKWKKKSFSASTKVALSWILLSTPILLAGGWSVLQQWRESATSGRIAKVSLEGVHVAGRESQGLPALLFRVFHWDPYSIPLVVGICILLSVAGIWTWRKVASRQNDKVIWMGALALLPIFQPLAGFYSFIFAFPLACSVVNEEWRRLHWKSASRFALGILAIALICWTTQKSLGSALGGWLEFISVKSFGVLLLAYLAASRRPV